MTDKRVTVNGKTYDREHGTRPGYMAGCKCKPCVDANRKYQREWVAAKRARTGQRPRERKS